MNTYLSSVRLSDKAFEGLVEYFSKVDEPTIIMMYGDHQPSWDDETKELLAQHPAWEDESLQTLSQYYVPYIVWANYDIEEHNYLLGWNEKVSSSEKLHLNSLSTNYVGTYLMSQAGVELSEYDKYLLNLHEEVPAITAIGVWDKDGNYYGDAASSPFSERLKNQEMIQYNLIFDDKNKLNECFLP
ncbi:MAG: sulfatase-like hydrolase/transferase [Eubacterium sp.]|nr:sulfatase-like hydrolase/transferase [Eubacterium sp.]